MTHHRLFVALAIPAEARAELLAGMGGVVGARWQDDAQLHCTVRFLGELDVHSARDVAATLAGLSHPAIDATIEGLGIFGRAGQIDTLWVGIHPLAALRALHAKIDRLLTLAGIPSDDRAYRPHVTIARFSKRDRPPSGIVASIAPPRPILCKLDALRLYESRLGREGAHYDVVEHYPLR